VVVSLMLLALGLSALTHWGVFAIAAAAVAVAVLATAQWAALGAAPRE
jgi:hypothetical protein